MLAEERWLVFCILFTISGHKIPAGSHLVSHWTIYLALHHHGLSPGSTTINVLQLSRHEIMSAYCTDHRHPPWMHLRSRRTRVPSILPAEGSSLCGRPPRSAGTPASLCAHTAVTFSGITRESAFLIEFPVKIKRGPWKSVSSVQRVARRPPKCPPFVRSSRAVSAWKI